MHRPVCDDAFKSTGRVQNRSSICCREILQNVLTQNRVQKENKTEFWGEVAKIVTTT